MRHRALTPAEAFSLTPEQKAYLLSHPDMVSLEPHVLAREALYQTALHGAVTINRAIELDACHAQYRARLKSEREQPSKPPFDGYSDKEDTFIDRHGMASSLW